MLKKDWQWSNLKWLWLSLGIILLDQVAKLWIVHWLRLYETHRILPVFSFTLLHNTGAAFSFLDGSGLWASLFLTSVSLLVSLAIVIWILRTEQNKPWLLMALALILGGALGNLWDRMTLGYVVDFLLFHYQHWYFPAFNVADSSITLGAIMLIIEMVFFQHEQADTSQQ